MISSAFSVCAAGKEEKPGLLTLLVEDCLKNPYIWLLAISYFFVYVVRQGVTSWFIFYLRVRLMGASCFGRLHQSQLAGQHEASCSPLRGACVQPLPPDMAVMPQ